MPADSLIPRPPVAAAFVLVSGLGVLGVPGITGVPAAWAQPPLVGEWHWNPAESSAAPSQPREVVLVITAGEPARVAWTLTGIDARGQSHVHAYRGTGDGKPAPVDGAPEGTVAAFTVTGDRMTASYDNRDGSTSRTTCQVDAAPRRLVCEGTDRDAAGVTTRFRDIYDRR